jgi:hypothetical protein
MEWQAAHGMAAVIVVQHVTVVTLRFFAARRGLPAGSPFGGAPAPPGVTVAIRM